MLVRLIVENIFSFYEKTEFNMLSNPKRGRFSEHVYKELPVHLLKQAVIYGANGAGKSNLLHVLTILKGFVCKKKSITPNKISELKFRLIENNKKPINIEIEFIEGQTCFYYSTSFSIDNIKEFLYLSGCGEKQDQLLFERNSVGNKHYVKIFDKQGKNLTNPVIDGVISAFFSKNNYASTFAMFEDLGIVKDLTIKRAYKWFNTELMPLGTNPQLKSLITIMEKNEDYARFANEIVCNMGIGINKVQVKTESIKSFLTHIDDADGGQEQKANLLKFLSEQVKDSEHIGNRAMEIVKENGEFVVKTLEFSQTGIDGYEGMLDFTDQSNGTIQLMHLLPILYQIVNTKCVYCVDEIENGIHPINIKAFIKLFTENRKTKGQLIFTTHECHLLNQQELMRADEVWFAEKHNGMTKLYSLNDFKEHNTIDIEKGYLAGRYGAIPFLGMMSQLNGMK